MDKYKYLKEQICNTKSLICLVGNGASMETKLKSGNRFPSFGEIINQVIVGMGGDCSDIDDKKKYKTFRKYADDLGDDFSKYIKTFIDANPSPCHLHFFSFLTGNLKDKYSSLIVVTTNYDNIIEQTFESINIPYESISLDYRLDFSNTDLEVIAQSLKQQKPVILHIFGDVFESRPVYMQEDMGFPDKTYVFLKNLFSDLVISIGYSYSDKSIKEIVFNDSRSNRPLLNVSPDSLDLESEYRDYNRREIIETNEVFSNATINILNKLYNDTNNTTSHQLKEIYESRLTSINYKNKFDFKFLKWRVNVINNMTINKFESKYTHDKKIEDIFIDRKSIDWKYLTDNNKSIIPVIGDAGTGKSTLFYLAAKKQYNDDLFLLINSSSLISIDFTTYLSRELLCKENEIEAFLCEISEILQENNKHFIILIDGINELDESRAIFIKSDIENLLKIKLKNITISITCRSYFWNRHLEQDGVSYDLYHTPVQLNKYSEQELEEAFAHYKSYFKFSGNLNNNIDLDFREKLKDPLMLRLMAQGYAGTAIPKFAPAVKIFSMYFDRLIQLSIKSKILNLEKFLDSLAQFYWDLECNKLVGTTGVKERELSYKGFSGNALEFLKDNNILYKDGDALIFTYERFFEYILGRYICTKQEWDYGKLSIDEIAVLWIECITSNKPYTYSFSLKSAVILSDYQMGSESFLKNPELIRGLVDGGTSIPIIPAFQNQNFRFFGIDLLRESISELRSYTKEINKEHQDTRNIGYITLEETLEADDFDRILLEVGRDDYRSIPFQIDLLSKPDDNIKRQVMINFCYLCNDTSHIELIIESAESRLISGDKHTIEGIAYLFPIFIKYYKLIRNEIGSSALEKFQEMVRRIHRNIKSRIIRNSFETQLMTCISTVYKRESPHFFGGNSRYDGSKYIIKMGEVERRYAGIISTLFEHPNNRRFNLEHIKSMRFFASQIEVVTDIEKQFNERHSVKPIRSWEYFCVRYILIERSKSDYNEVISILEGFIKSNLWLTFDFCMCTMESILRNIYLNNDSKYDFGLSKMKEWSDVAEYQYNDFFYWRLQVEDPLNFSFNPLSPLANTIIEKNPSAGFDQLNDRLKGGNGKSAKLALLSLRKISRKFPLAGKTSLAIAWSKRKNYDSQFSDWLNLFIAELSYINPSMIHSLYREISIQDYERIAIAKINPDPRTNEYNINEFFNYMLEDEGFRENMLNIYYELLDKKEIDLVFKETVRRLVLH